MEMIYKTADDYTLTESEATNMVIQHVQIDDVAGTITLIMRPRIAEDGTDEEMLAALIKSCAMEEDRELAAEFEALEARGELPEVPTDLDRKCREIINNFPFSGNEEQG